MPPVPESRQRWRALQGSTVKGTSHTRQESSVRPGSLGGQGAAGGTRRMSKNFWTTANESTGRPQSLQPGLHRCAHLASQAARLCCGWASGCSMGCDQQLEQQVHDLVVHPLPVATNACCQAAAKQMGACKPGQVPQPLACHRQRCAPRRWPTTRSRSCSGKGRS